MKKIILIAVIAFALIGCNSRSGQRKELNDAKELEKYRAEAKAKALDTEHNVYIRFNGIDKNIPEDGELLVVKCSLVDTVIVEPATDDDCRRILESHGKG